MADSTMRAARFHDYGPPENLVVEAVPVPQPKDGEVLVRVHAAGVNPVDWKFRKGMYKANNPLQLPYIAGFDLAGVVEAVGPGVTGFAKGQAIYGRGTGSYAEYAVAPAMRIAPKPGSLSFDEAAAVPMGASTAWRGLFDVGGLEAGQTVLIHGAAGGIGVLGVQFAKWKGARVIGTASTANVDFVRSLGADEAIDYTATRFETVVRGVDVVLDTVGSDLIERSLGVLKKGGILVETGGPAPQEAAAKLGLRTSNVNTNTTTDLLVQVGELIDAGKIRVVLGKVFPLEKAAEAHALSETGHGRGRIVLHVAD